MHRSDPLRLTLVLGAGALAGCGLFRPRPVDVPRVHVQTPEGVRYVDVQEGIGPAVGPGDLVRLDYTAYLADGTQVDSSHDRGQPLEVRLGEAPIAGWNEGLVGMRTNGVRRIQVPAALAYGAEGVPGLVPPNADMVFEIELLGGVAAEDAGTPDPGADDSGPEED